MLQVVWGAAHLPPRVRIVEVGARDGLQNEKVPIATSDKIELINRSVFGERGGFRWNSFEDFVNALGIKAHVAHSMPPCRLHFRIALRQPGASVLFLHRRVLPLGTTLAFVTKGE